jgi:hypothetical protein
MKVVFLSHVCDSKGSNGGMVYSNQIISQLRRICERVETLYVYPTPPKSRALKILLAFAKSVFDHKPAKVLYFDRTSTHRALERLVKSAKPDAVIFDHLETVVYLRPFLERVPVVLVQHNDEANLYDERLSKVRSPFASTLLAREGRKLREFQRHALARIRNKIFISSEEMKDAEQDSADNRFCLLPSFDYSAPPEIANGTDASTIDVAFLGNMNWWPNQDAVNWLITEVMPHVGPHVRLHLIGMNSDAEAWRRPNVVGHGFLKDSADIWKKANVFLAPIVSGAGLNLKVAEAIYNRKSIITTPMGIRGIPLASDASILIRTTAAQWIDTLNDVSQMKRLNSTPPDVRNSDLFERSRSCDRLKSFLETCR